MSLVEEQIATLENAKPDILKILKEGPIKTGDLLAKLGHSCGDFYFTKMIGDNRGYWNNSPHELALTDLVESGKIAYGRDLELDVWYWVGAQPPFVIYLAEEEPPRDLGPFTLEELEELETQWDCYAPEISQGLMACPICDGNKVGLFYSTIPCGYYYEYVCVCGFHEEIGDLEYCDQKTKEWAEEDPNTILKEVMSGEITRSGWDPPEKED